MDFSARDFNTQEKIELLQRWILVHSYLYYELDINIVSDHAFDNNCRELNDMKINHPEDWGVSRYTYAMDDFNGSTGFGYVEKLNKKDLNAVSFTVAMLMEVY